MYIDIDKCYSEIIFSDFQYVPNPKMFCDNFNNDSSDSTTDDG